MTVLILLLFDLAARPGVVRSILRYFGGWLVVGVG